MTASIAVLDNETWLPVSGYEGLYEVSDAGRVKSLVKRNTKYRRFLNPCTRSDGYLTVGLFNSNGVPTNVLVHRLVLTAFRGEAPGMQAAHLNGVRSDNRLSNLTWATAAINASHKLLHGTAPQGERNGAAYLNESTVVALRREYRRGSRTHGCTALARKYGTTPSNVWLIVTRQHWKHVA